MLPGSLGRMQLAQTDEGKSYRCCHLDWMLLMLMMTSQTGSDIAFHHSDIEKQSYCWRLSKSHNLFYGKYIFLQPMCGTQKLTKNLEAHSNMWLKSRQCPSLQSGLKFHQIYDGQSQFFSGYCFKREICLSDF